MSVSSHAMSTANPRPPLQPLGPTWRAVRKELRTTAGEAVRQEDVAQALGFGPNGQAYVSVREKHPAENRAVEPTVAELVAFEDAFGLERGTVLRRAGYVTDPYGPLDQIDSWTFLDPKVREAIKRMVDPEWQSAGRPIPTLRRRRQGAGPRPV